MQWNEQICKSLTHEAKYYRRIRKTNNIYEKDNFSFNHAPCKSTKRCTLVRLITWINIFQFCIVGSGGKHFSSAWCVQLRASARPRENCKTNVPAHVTVRAARQRRVGWARSRARTVAPARAGGYQSVSPPGPSPPWGDAKPCLGLPRQQISHR